MFEISHHNSGFGITFKNGWTVSVQWSPINYCENRWKDGKTYKCSNAEIAAWKGDKWYRFNTDDVKGWVEPEEVAEFIAMISKL